MNRAQGERFEGTHEIVSAVLIIEQLACGTTVGISPRPVRHPSHHRAVPPQRSALDRALWFREMFEAVRRRKEHQAPAAQQILRLQRAGAKSAGQIAETGGAGQDHYLLADLQPFLNETKKFSRTFLLPNDKLAGPEERGHSDRVPSGTHSSIIREIAD